MQKIVLFIESNDDAFYTPFKAGHLFMNRFTIEEGANFEIVEVFELGNSSDKMSCSFDPIYSNFEKNREQKGMSLSTLINITLLNHVKSNKFSKPRRCTWHRHRCEDLSDYTVGIIQRNLRVEKIRNREFSIENPPHEVPDNLKILNYFINSFCKYNLPA